MKKSYDDLYELKPPVSQKHVKMSIEHRAAQFSPFAALTGYEDAINETGRYVDQKTELTEEEILEINHMIRKIQNTPHFLLPVSITYFQHDLLKSGGFYLEKQGYVKKIHEPEQYLIMDDKSKINFVDILAINEVDPTDY